MVKKVVAGPPETRQRQKYKESGEPMRDENGNFLMEDYTYHPPIVVDVDENERPAAKPKRKTAKEDILS